MNQYVGSSRFLTLIGSLVVLASYASIEAYAEGDLTLNLLDFSAAPIPVEKSEIPGFDVTKITRIRYTQQGIGDSQAKILTLSGVSSDGPLCLAVVQETVDGNPKCHPPVTGRSTATDKLPSIDIATAYTMFAVPHGNWWCTADMAHPKETANKPSPPITFSVKPTLFKLENSPTTVTQLKAIVAEKFGCQDEIFGKQSLATYVPPTAHVAPAPTAPQAPPPTGKPPMGLSLADFQALINDLRIAIIKEIDNRIDTIPDAILSKIYNKCIDFYYDKNRYLAFFLVIVIGCLVLKRFLKQKIKKTTIIDKGNIFYWNIMQKEMQLPSDVCKQIGIPEGKIQHSELFGLTTEEEFQRIISVVNQKAKDRKQFRVDFKVSRKDSDASFDLLMSGSFVNGRKGFFKRPSKDIIYEGEISIVDPSPKPSQDNDPSSERETELNTLKADVQAIHLVVTRLEGSVKELSNLISAAPGIPHGEGNGIDQKNLDAATLSLVKDEIKQALSDVFRNHPSVDKLEDFIAEQKASFDNQSVVIYKLFNHILSHSDEYQNIITLLEDLPFESMQNFQKTSNTEIVGLVKKLVESLSYHANESARLYKDLTGANEKLAQANSDLQNTQNQLALKTTACTELEDSERSLKVQIDSAYDAVAHDFSVAKEEVEKLLADLKRHPNTPSLFREVLKLLQETITQPDAEWDDEHRSLCGFAPLKKGLSNYAPFAFIRLITPLPESQPDQAPDKRQVLLAMLNLVFNPLCATVLRSFRLLNTYCPELAETKTGMVLAVAEQTVKQLLHSAGVSLDEITFLQPITAGSKEDKYAKLGSQGEPNRGNAIYEGKIKARFKELPGEPVIVTDIVVWGYSVDGQPQQKTTVRVWDKPK